MTKLAYILAASHSGSTLLSMLLASHPQVATIGELKLSPETMGDLDRYRCSCGEFIQECGFWRKVKKSMAYKHFEFALAYAGTEYSTVESHYARRFLGPLHRGRFLENLRDAALCLSSVWRKQLPEIHRRNAALASTVCEITKAEVIVDSSKIGVRLKYLLRNPELDAKVIRLIRDGRATGLDKGGLVLGVDADAEYEIQTLKLHDGDTLLFYTDGLIDAMDFEGRFWGRERMLDSARRFAQCSAASMVRNMLGYRRRFVGLARQIDDTSVITVKVGGPWKECPECDAEA